MKSTRSARRQISGVIVGIAAISLLVGCSSGAAAPKDTDSGKTYTMTIGTENNTGDFIEGGAEAFQKAIEQSPIAGRLKVKVVCCQALGAPADTWKSMELGTIQGFVGPSQAPEAQVPVLNTLDLMYLFKDFDARNKAIDDPDIGGYFTKAIGKQGVTVLGWFGGGERNIYGNGTPVRTPADLKGRKIRVLTSATFTDTYVAFGAVPTDIPFSDVYLALSQNTVDLVDTAFDPALAAKQDEVAKNWSVTKQAYGLSLLAVNSKWFKSLPADIQSEINKAATKAKTSERKAEVAAEKSDEAKLKAAGKTVTYPNTAPFSKVARGVWATLISSSPNNYNKDIINQILKSEGESGLQK